MLLRTNKSRVKPALLASLSVVALSLAISGMAIAEEKKAEAVPAATEAAPAAPATSGEFTAEQKTQIQAVIKDYLVENPEIIAEAMTALQIKQQQQQQEQALSKLEAHKDFFSSADLGTAGNKDGDVTVIEFFDYNCGYCKKAFEDVNALLEKDKNVKVVFVEMPILSETSQVAAQWALAAKEQGKYFEFHKALMEFQGNKDEAALTEIAKKLELDIEKMKTDAASEKTQNTLVKSIEVSRDIGIQGTPAFVVGKQLFRGYIGTEALIKSVQDERS